MLYHSLLDDFQVPQVALRLWGKVPEQSYLPELAATSQELREYAAGLGVAVLRHAGAVRIARLVRMRSRRSAPSRSCRCEPIRPSGCSALGSETPGRYYPGMGTMYLTRLAELASVATARFLPQG